EVLYAGLADRVDQRLRDAAQAEAAGHDQHAVLEETRQRRLGVGIDLLHALEPLLQRWAMRVWCPVSVAEAERANQAPARRPGGVAGVSPRSRLSGPWPPAILRA